MVDPGRTCQLIRFAPFSPLPDSPSSDITKTESWTCVEAKSTVIRWLEEVMEIDAAVPN